MMLLPDNPSRRPPLEPVLPLINVVFLLLIFFMLAGQLAKKPSVAVETPVSETAQGEEQFDKLLLVLNAEGDWFLEDSEQPLDNDSLAQHLQALPEDAPVRLLADAGVSIEQLRRRLETLRDLGVQQVRMVTQNEVQP